MQYQFIGFIFLNQVFDALNDLIVWAMLFELELLVLGTFITSLGLCFLLIHWVGGYFLDFLLEAKGFLTEPSIFFSQALHVFTDWGCFTFYWLLRSVEIVAVIEVLVNGDWLPVDTDEIVWQLHKSWLFNQSLDQTFLWLVDQKSIIFVKTPSINVSILINGKGSLISCINLYNVLQFLYFMWCIFNSYIGSSMSKLCLFIGSPRINFTLAVKRKHMRSPRGNSHNSGRGSEVNFTDVEALLSKFLVR